MKTQILDASVEFYQRPFLKPLQISSGTIHEITEARANVTVRVGNQEATGRGSIYLSDLWGWPAVDLSHATRDAAMCSLCTDIAVRLSSFCGGEAQHPLELGLRLHESVAHLENGVQPHPPLLARLICASPFDAALHDATGLALGCSAFDFYHEKAPIPSADALFASRNTSDSITRTLQSPRDALDAWYLVSLSDTPKELAPWVQQRGYRCFKIKIGGQDNAVDVARTREVFAQVSELGDRDAWISVDSNCANPDANSVLDYLKRLESEDAAAYAALQFVEQPTGRNIVSHAFDWRSVSRRKSVLLDEGLLGFQVLPVAQAQGWGGLALKTCKGHSFALVAAVWAHEEGLQLSMQDLTNPGLAAIHAALLTARLPISLGIELNSPQFTPAANQEWLPRLDALFNVKDGKHRLSNWNPSGLGSTL